jgi:ligand-binding SRPBCC domain-containing protein
VPRLLETEILLPGLRPEDVFPFFADARNLQKLTPPWLSLAVETASPIDLREGTLVDYRLRLHGLPLRWRSAITRWEPPLLFEDTQVRGPYRLWRHTHRFEAREGGTLASDCVVYDMIGGVLADVMVRPDLRRVFAFRARRLPELLGLGPLPPAEVRFGRA